MNPDTRKPGLTQGEVDTLERIDELITRHGACGMFPRGAGGWAQVRAMERRGLVRFVGIGTDIDGDAGHEVSIFDMTDAGRAALDAHRGSSR